MKEFSDVFLQKERTQQEIEEAGNKALAAVYGGMRDLDLERASKFTEKVASQSCYMTP